MSSDNHQAENLLQQARDGNVAALNRLFELYREKLRARAEKKLPIQILPRVDASDAVQQTLLEGFRAFPNFDGDRRQFEAWLYAIHEHQILDLIRRHKLAAKRSVKNEIKQQREDQPSVVKDQQAGDTTPCAAAIRAEELRLTEQALSRLSDLERQAFVLRHQQNLSLEEVAQRLGQTYQSIVGITYRARKKLRDRLNPP